MKIKSISCLLIITCALSSCEAFLKYQGNVYNSKNEPVENARISLILQKKYKFEYMSERLDTLSSAERKKLRKKGIKDNFRYTYRGLVEPVPLYTDKNEYFETRSILVGCPFKCPKAAIQVEKDTVVKIFPIEEPKETEYNNDSLSLRNFRERPPKKLSLVL
ncbi:hypothetical protein FY557_08195 [Chryseobacterium sp. SN22]|uniref:hypothetical protein n=1 Tax=Chryseobacterium sp. SN22 TaxID=2606431 RepID=UPI00125804DB|nr:hypothetical protein [Chryseobacterium sp. SN22]KAA0128551.1 hypothetical protein FY557_08195 [Chryseobacterium sp. SN22]